MRRDTKAEMRKRAGGPPSSDNAGSAPHRNAQESLASWRNL